MKSIEQSVTDLGSSVDHVIERIYNEEDKNIKSCLEGMLRIFDGILKSWEGLVKWSKQMEKWIEENK